MKLLTWDSGYCWDDPNLRWGDPAYVLEPGDPGYVPPPVFTPVVTQKPKRSHMPKSDYVSQNDAAFAAQLQTLKNGLAGHATVLGIAPAQLTALAADAAYFAYVLACQQAAQNDAQAWTAWKLLIRGGGAATTDTPGAAAFPTSVPTVPPGVEVRYRGLVKLIKASANYTLAIGEELGIEGAEHVTPNLDLLQPVIKVNIAGTQVYVDWGWQGQSQFLDQCEIQVDRGQGFVMLAIDTTPGYTDTQPLPATPTKWTYRAIYRAGDNRTGTWSNPVSITVGG